MIKDQSPSGSDSDENVSLKRAVSEPSPNMSLKSYDSDVFHFVPSMPWTGYRFPSFDGLNRLDSVFDYGLIHPETLQKQNNPGLMASRLQIEGDESVLLHVTHSNLKSFNADVRFSLQMSVEAVKEKLWKKCGTSVNSMSLELYDDTGAKIAELSDNSRPFGFYSPLDGYRLHIVDLDPSSVTSGGWLEDTSLVEKYKISDEAYEKRDGTFRKFKEKLAHQKPSCASTKVADNYMEDLCANIKVGDRCQVEPGEKRGVVKYVGRAENLGPGFWVGVQYDEPLGKHDGLVKGTRYFNCPPNHGGMVRPDKVQVGDYPERDPFEEEEI